MIWIGIDPGTHTGFAVWDTKSKKLVELDTMMIHQAFKRVFEIMETEDIRLRIEDARHVSRDGYESRARLQGAGSIKRDCSIWEDFCEDYDIPYMFVRPGKGTKPTPEYFKLLTGWKGRTSNHARDAAMLVFGK